MGCQSRAEVRRRGVLVDPRRATVPWAVVASIIVAVVACSPGDGDEANTAATPAAGTAGMEASPTGAGSPMAMPATPGAGTLPVEGTPGVDGFRTAAADGGAVVWATAVDPTTKAPTEPVETFPTDARTMYAAVPLARLEPGTTLTATWTYNRTPLDGMVGSVTAPAGEAGRDVWVAFELERQTDEPWPNGTYAITVAVNGEPALTAAVEVQNASTEG